MSTEAASTESVAEGASTWSVAEAASAQPVAEHDVSAPRHAAPRRRRRVLWVSLAAGALLAALVAVLASSPPANEILTASPLLGKPAPPLSGRVLINGPPGGQVRLAAYRGKWVLVNFAASWCVPCRVEMPQLLLFAKQHQVAADATILTVAYDEGDLANLRTFLQERSVTWPAVVESSAKITYGVGGLPESFLVDPEGTTVAVVEGGAKAADLDALITKYSPPSRRSS